ncbi:MAG: class I SAM-dependent methyltransferase [Ilumatobacteraceae bacterium]|nr:class I SAM-dependent methyltransferase [Ilumatobacteraceae bacterium]
MTSDDRVTRARSLRTPDDAVRLYDSWAADYDHDVFEVMGFIGTDRIADLLATHVPDRDQPVIDLGCGTGAAGVRLAHHGFGSIDGVDISSSMLDVAAQLGVYRHLLTADLTQPLTIEHCYGASISAGTFTTGHVGADAIPALVKLLQPGAVVAWVIAEQLWPSFQQTMEQQGLHMVHIALEQVRRNGPPESMMVVARLRSSPAVGSAQDFPS